MEPAYEFPMSARPAHGASPANATELRRLSSAEDYAQAIELQRLTWGPSFQEVVPAAILKVSQRVGGICAGAFDRDGVLQAFVYGMTGVEDGRLIHWSHMLAVRPESRDRGLGRQLKVFQRELLQDSGVEFIYWTFDPLVARNAHLNLNVLGIEVREYVRDMYEGSGSPLHVSGTDRLVAAWPVGEIAAVQMTSEATVRDTPVFSAEAVGAPVLRIEIPEEMGKLNSGDAHGWRVRTREAFLVCLRSEYQVRGFYRSADGRCYYVLTKGAATAR